jgi:hypothetical protein
MRTRFISGLVPEMYDTCLAIQQYTDEGIFMFENILDNARNIKITLCTFENLTGKNNS